MFGDTTETQSSGDAPANRALGREGTGGAPPGKEPGRRIGRYRLLERIGEGGFGVVFRAEQLEPVKQTVALKIIKLGMDTEQVVARFEAERQALALMDHPNIARVLDGGATKSGRPYFAMELVQGVSITEFCDTHRYSTAARLALFVTVCRAVQHAHHKGIVHRDIKPSNILVAPAPAEDAHARTSQGIPKVIDFGIAKATQMELTEHTVFTGLNQFLGTPVYMSPEQLEVSAADMDTRSDIYSLGVLLYELLTGTTPFSEEELRKAGYAEMTRIIREQAPPRPSIRLTQMQVSQSHQIKNQKSKIENDLDWIVMKCLEKDRTRRYETANALALDVQRHLDREPVLAVGPSRIYRLKKLVQRNRMAFFAGAAVALALVLGLVGSLWQAHRAAQSERQQRALRRQSQARAYAADMNLAQQALSVNNLGRTRLLLDRYRPQSPDETDFRAWEWRYLWQQSRSEALATLCDRSNYIDSLSISANGNWLAIGEKLKGRLTVWDLHTKRKVASLPGGLSAVQVAFSSTELLLAFSAITSPAENELASTVFLWDGSTREIVGRLPLNGDCAGMAFSSDGTRLATFTSASADQVSLWQIPDGSLLSTCSATGLQGSPGHKVAFDRNLTPAACGATGGIIRIFDPVTGAVRRAVSVTQGMANAVALSPDGKRLAAGTGLDGGALYLWDVETGRQIVYVEPRLAHRGRIDILRFWPDGKRLVSGASDQTLCVWDLASLSDMADMPKPLRLRGHRRPVRDVALLPDNATLVSGCEDGSVLIWDSTQSRPDHSHIVLSGAFVAWRWAADSRSVVTLDANGRVVRWHGVDFQEATTLMEIGPSLLPGTFSSDLRRLATGSAKGKLQVWDLIQGKLLTEFKGRLWPRTFLSQGDSLLVKDIQDGRIKAWSLAKGQAFRSWETHGLLLGNILSADDRWLIRLMERGRLLLTDRTANQVVELDPSMPGAYGSAFSTDGKYVAVASYLGLARVWETTTGREVATFRGTQQGVHAAGFSPDGRRLATCSQGAEAIKLWDLESRRELLTLAARDEIFISTEFSPNGNLLGAMHHRGALHLWRAPSWEDIASAEGRQGPQAKP